MNEIPIFKRPLVERLWLDVEKNIDSYINGDLTAILQQPEYKELTTSVSSTELAEDDLAMLEKEATGVADAKNAAIIYKSMKCMTPHLAADERVWVALTHMKAPRFSFQRYAKNFKSTEDAVRLVKTHFFARTGGSRGLHRNNALSCLWWYAHVLAKNEKHSLEKLTTSILSKTDFRAQLFERPTTARVKPVCNAITDIVIEEIKRDSKPKILERKAYREWFRKINLNGGIKLYASMSEQNVKALFRDLLP